MNHLDISDFFFILKFKLLSRTLRASSKSDYFYLMLAGVQVEEFNDDVDFGKAPNSLDQLCFCKCVSFLSFVGVQYFHVPGL